MINAVIDGQAYRINDEDGKNLVGHGGEANVYRFEPSSEFVARHGRNRYVVKIFKKAKTDAMRRSDDERQMKLLSFPKGLPSEVIAPVALAFDQASDRVIGYVMPLVPDGTPLINLKSHSQRARHSITNEKLCQILANLHDLVSAVHRLDVVIGDLNDKNVLVGPNLEVYLLDADSLQFGRWECPAFVPEFVDPLIVSENTSDPKALLKKVKGHSQQTDWYAFTVMAFQLFVRVNPYMAGFYMPASGEAPVKGAKRILRQISVFHPRVTLPDMATPLDTLPEQLEECFRLVFEEHRRGEFPKALLTETRWSECPTCKITHGRQTCPKCATASRPVPPPRQTPKPAPPLPKPNPPRTSQPPMHILSARSQDGQARYVYHQSGAYRREGNVAFWQSATCDSRISAIPAGDRTVMASRSSFVVFDGRQPGIMQTQVHLGRTTVAANGRHVYWLNGNQLVRDDVRDGTTTIGTIAPNSTSVWVGDQFGLVFEQAGVLARIKVFDTERPGFRTATLPPIFESVVGATCVVGDGLAWFTLSTKGNGRVTNRCYAIDSTAQLRGAAEAPVGDTWLGSVTEAAQSIRGKLFTPVPRIGIVQLGIRGGVIGQEAVYQVSSALVPNRDATVGLCVTSRGVTHFGTTTITTIS